MVAGPVLANQHSNALGCLRSSYWDVLVAYSILTVSWGRTTTVVCACYLSKSIRQAQSVKQLLPCV